MHGQEQNRKSEEGPLSEEVLMAERRVEDKLGENDLPLDVVSDAQVTQRIYTHIALSLARGYTDLYYVNIETDEFIEFHTDDEHGVLSEVRRGDDFFEGCDRDVKLFVHPEDQELFVTTMNRDFLENALAQSRVHELIYRRIKGGKSFYVEMKISRMEDDGRFLVLAVTDVDELVKNRQAEERVQEERLVYARLHALTGNFLCVYVVDPITDDYWEFSSTDVYDERFAQAKEGTDFFNVVRKAAKTFNYPDDLGRFLALFTKDNVLAEVEKGGIFTLPYRLLVENQPVYVQMKAAMVEEKEGPRLIVGLNNVDLQVRHEEETASQLAEAQAKAEIDALTGVKNKHAYLAAESVIDRKIAEGSQEPFAVTILDINDLKKINDTKGHQAGDRHIRAACKTICDIFKHSPVFRTGGDEFAVLSQGEDYKHIEELIWQMAAYNVDASHNDGVVIATGMAKFENDTCVASVFERADQDMYKNKNALKVVEDELSASGSIGHQGQAAIDSHQYDYLTGLPNMSSFIEHAAARKDAILEKGGYPVMLYADFSGMKFANAKYGFAEGDKILQEFAKLMIRAFGKENSCRIGADHFAAVSEEAGLEYKLNRLFCDFSEARGGKTLPVHIGVYPNRIEDVDASTACDRAKLACSVLKGSYSSMFSFYNEKLREETVMRQYIIENFETALRERWVQVYLQPIIRTVNERVCDVEALARWDDPVKGLLPPALFVPAIEEAGMIYKLDLYMLERVLDSIKLQDDAGTPALPHSINLSRADFDSCDIVEEIRKRVDAAGIKRDMITIEVTESIIGSNFDFMKEQIERFQKLGFPVWMDDFGSGYSSLDVLQSIKFDLIKFDMSFMHKLDEGEDGKVVLTDLMRMATSLGVDTLCEGVETEAQVQFLQEIGCSKIQGYYFSKPMPLETIQQMWKNGQLPENENPEESSYYENIGRVNLYDLGVIAHEGESSIQNTFNTLPMGIIEIKDDCTRWVRSNQSYRDFVKRFFGYELSRLGSEFVKYDDAFMLYIVKTCCEQGIRAFYDQKMPDGSVVHSFARLIDRNPVTGSFAVVVAVLSINAPDEETSYADIARALAADYYNIYVIDLEADTYIEYSSIDGGDELSLERHGVGFFESARKDANTRIYEGDREMFWARFSREAVIDEINQHGVYSITYRLIDTEEPTFVNMKIMRLDEHRLILGVSIVDAQVKQQEEAEKLRQERAALMRIAALAEEYIVLYAINPATGHYMQYNPSSQFEKLGLAHKGDDFFGDVVKDAQVAIPQEDMERHLKIMSEENVMKTLRECGRLVYDYRLILDGKPVPAHLKAVLMEDEDGEKIILGSTIDEES